MFSVLLMLLFLKCIGLVFLWNYSFNQTKVTFVTGPAKIDYVSAKIADFSVSIFRTEDISYRKIYVFNHPLFKLLNLLLRRYVMSGIIQVVTRPQVQTYHQPVYSRWVLSWLVPHWHTCFNYQSLLASFHWTGLVQMFLFTINQFDIKIMERIIHYQFVHALESHNLLSDFQFSFCHKCSIVSPSTGCSWLGWITWL